MNKKNKKTEKEIVSEEMKKFLEGFGYGKDKIEVPYFPPVNIPNKCPNCGYCPHCGRGGHNPNIFPNVYCGGTSNGIF